MPNAPAPTPAPNSDSRFFGHPLGLATLFFTELWERFSYYGMRAILILYMTKTVLLGGLEFSNAKAGAVYGMYTSMVYLMCLAGGWIADRITGQRKAVLAGGIFIAAGEFSLAVPGESFFYLGLVLLMFGTGFLKGNVSTIVGQLYRKGDPRRDSGFSLFYMGINIGALISPAIIGYIGERISWRLGFAVAGIGMLIGVVVYLVGGKYLGTAGLYPATSGNVQEDQRQKRNALLAMGGGLGVFALLAVLGATGVVQMSAESIFDLQGWFLLALSVLIFAWLIFSGGWSLEERKRSAAVLVLFVASAIFWGSFEQAGSSLNLFAEQHTNRFIMGWEFPASWFQFVQPVFVVILAPVFAWMWFRLSRKQSEPSAPAKFSFGLLFAGLSFAILIPAAKITEGGVQVGIWWLNATYLLQTLGELNLSPVGLSAMTKLAPDRAQGFIMGMWFLSTSIGNWMAGKAVTFYGSVPLATIFTWIAVPTIIAAFVLMVLTKPTVKLMSGVK